MKICERHIPGNALERDESKGRQCSCAVSRFGAELNAFTRQLHTQECAFKIDRSPRIRLFGRLEVMK